VNDREQKVQILKILAALITVIIPALALGQVALPQRAPNKQASAERGKELFSEYCTSCHGVSGKGDGPAASALKIPPADLTALAAHNKGQFPSLRVMQAIKAGPSVPAHGSEIMPVWGPIFLRGDSTDTAGQVPPQTPAGVAEEGGPQDRHGATAAEVQLRIYNLMEYIRTLQSK
jgi:mono/diheme cytochrome c family protein